MILVTGKRKNNKGFLLLEAMVSVAILSIGLVLILNSFMSSIRAIGLSRDYFRASLLLEEKIFEIYNSDVKTGSSSGKFNNFYNTFSWNLDMVKLEDEDLNEVSLRISWDQGSLQKALSITTYL